MCPPATPTFDVLLALLGGISLGNRRLGHQQDLVDFLQRSRLALHVLLESGRRLVQAPLQFGALTQRVRDVLLGRVQSGLGAFGPVRAVRLFNKESCAPTIWFRIKYIRTDRVYALLYVVSMSARRFSACALSTSSWSLWRFCSFS